MLLKIERTILRKLSKQPNSLKINAYNFPQYDNADIYQAMQSLKDMGYLVSFDATVDYETFSYILSSKGRHYREYAWGQLLRNVIIPFIVALLTTIATLYLEKLVENDKPADASGYTSEYGDDN